MVIEYYWEALIFSAALLGTHGPAVIALFSSAIQYGIRTTLPFFLGIILGFFINLLVSSFFIGSAFYLSDTLLLVFKGIASVYMIYLAYKIATNSFIERKALANPMRFSHGILLNLLNPKAYVAAFSSFSIFVIKTDILSSIAILILINLTVAAVLQGAWVIIGDKLSALFKKPVYNRLISIMLSLVMIAMIAFAFIG